MRVRRAGRIDGEIDGGSYDKGYCEKDGIGTGDDFFLSERWKKIK